MTTTNQTTAWYLAHMPNLTKTLTQLSEAGVEIISIDTKTSEPFYYQIHCFRDEAFRAWIQTQDWEFLPRPESDTFPAESVTWVNGCKVFALVTPKEYREWEQ